MPAQRPGTVTAAAITMIVLGALIVLLGLIAVLVGAVAGGVASGAAGELTGEETAVFGTLGGAIAGAILVFAVIFLAIGILEIVAGAKVLSGRGWARITGIVLGIILGLFSLVGLFGGDQGGSPIVSLIFVVANAFIVFALITGGGWFAARSAASA